MIAKFFKYTLVLVLFFIIEKQDCDAQTIEMKMLIGGHPLCLDSNFNLNQTDSVQITSFKFYISGIEFWNNDSLMFIEKDSYHLIDMSKPASFHIPLDMAFKFPYNQIKFNLGIDSTTSTSGAMSGALDPLNGMYWTWQSGYINSKMEGVFFSKSVRKSFEFHLGGYQNPFNAIKVVSLKVNSLAIQPIQIDLLYFFKEIDLNKQNHLMQPSIEAVLLSGYLSNCFAIKY